jgi:hypothetical protein
MIDLVITVILNCITVYFGFGGEFPGNCTYLGFTCSKCMKYIEKPTVDIRKVLELKTKDRFFHEKVQIQCFAEEISVFPVTVITFFEFYQT